MLLFLCLCLAVINGGLPTIVSALVCQNPSSVCLRNDALLIIASFGLVCVAVAVLGAYVWIRNHHRKRLRVKTLGDLLALSPTQFEHAIADLLHDLGYYDVRRVGGAGDLAADIRCRDVQGRSVVVQCKRYAPSIRVGSPDIQKFIGMVVVHHKADQGIFVTTSSFTRPAIELGAHHGLMLIDGASLSRLIDGAHQGVRAGMAASMPASAAAADSTAPRADFYDND